MRDGAIHRARVQARLHCSGTVELVIFRVLQVVFLSKLNNIEK